MTDAEAIYIGLKFTELRTRAEYRAAEVTRRRTTARAMAAAEQNSPDHAAVRLLIGTWDRIAITVKSFNDKQRRQFFRCHPVALVWGYLEPAITVLRGTLGPRYAGELEALAGQYRKWTQTRDGQDYRTEAGQTICALFM
jgi:hypothetical protein